MGEADWSVNAHTQGKRQKTVSAMLKKDQSMLMVIVMQLFYSRGKLDCKMSLGIIDFNLLGT